MTRDQLDTLEDEAIRRFVAGELPGYSQLDHDPVTMGYGGVRPDEQGGFEFPLPVWFMQLHNLGGYKEEADSDVA